LACLKNIRTRHQVLRVSEMTFDMNCLFVMAVNCCRCHSLHTLRRKSTGMSPSEWNAKQLTSESMLRLRATLSPVSCHVKTQLSMINR